MEGKCERLRDTGTPDDRDQYISSVSNKFVDLSNALLAKKMFMRTGLDVEVGSYCSRRIDIN